jgi:hypothetical protein
MANPSPTGTFTLQDTPNLAWRETARQLTRKPSLFGLAVSNCLVGIQFRYFPPAGYVRLIEPC